MRSLRWLVWLAALAGCAYVVTAVEFGGRTLLDRLVQALPPARPSAGTPAGVAKSRSSDRKSDKTAATGHQTDEDRENLKKLIEDKLQPERPAAPDAGAAAQKGSAVGRSGTP